MDPMERLKLYRTESLDAVMLEIKNGNIKCGKYSHLVKVDPKKRMKGKVLFKDGEDNSSKSGQRQED